MKRLSPAISETELLNVLSDVVKRDSDPAVRGEALQGIFRLRSDASITTLISLYDSVNDIKLKGEIINAMLRRKGDNAKATAKLISIAKTEKEDELRRDALNAIARIGGDEAINGLIEVYDSLQDAKQKQRLIQSFSFSKNRKAVEKLIQIAKTDSDPTVRQSAIRALSNVDNRLYMELSGHEAPPAQDGAYGGVSGGVRGGVPTGVAPARGIGSGVGRGAGSGSGDSIQPARPPVTRDPK